MALFKIYRGSETNLPSAMTDGWAYFCTDTGSFYIDYADTTGKLQRKQINADFANGLRYVSGNEYIEISAKQIEQIITETNDLADAINELTGKFADFTTSKIYFSTIEPANLTTNDLWFELIN